MGLETIKNASGRDKNQVSRLRGATINSHFKEWISALDIPKLRRWDLVTGDMMADEEHT
jgi:hypothetical protein